MYGAIFRRKTDREEKTRRNTDVRRARSRSNQEDLKQKENEEKTK